MTVRKTVADGKLPNELLGQITHKWLDLLRRLGQGTLDPQRVLNGLQWVIEDKVFPKTEPRKKGLRRVGKEQLEFKRLISRVPFEPSMIGQNLTWWLGPKEGEGLKGEELDCDQRSLVLAEVDFVQVLCETCLKDGEPSIKGEEKLRRLIKSGVIRLDPAFGWALFIEEGQKTLRWLHDTCGVTSLDFFGRVLRLPLGDRCVLCLYWGAGRWFWLASWLGHVWNRHYPSAVLAK